MAINMVSRDGALASSRTGRLLVLLALPCVSHASQLPPAVENAVDFCISSRWGFSCFDASTTSRGVIARAGMAGVGRMVGRGALATMGAVVARETWVTMKELQQNKAGMAHQSLKQWLTNGPLPERQGPTAPMPAPAGITTGPILVADAVADAVAAEPMLAADAVAAEVPSGLEEAGPGVNADAWLAAEDTVSPAAPAPATPVPTSSMPAAAASTMEADISTSLDAAAAAPRVGAAASALGPRAVASLPRSFPSRSRARR